jgi:hypothetical protein
MTCNQTSVEGPIEFFPKVRDGIGPRSDGMTCKKLILIRDENQSAVLQDISCQAAALLATPSQNGGSHEPSEGIQMSHRKSPVF